MKNVVIIDDNIITVQGISENIDWKSIGAAVADIISSPQEFLDNMEKYDCDILVSDVCMPGINGLELSKRVLEIKPETKIILVSAYDNFGYAQEAIRFGAFDYVEKPIDYAYLSKVIIKALNEIRSEEEIARQLEASRAMLIDKFFNSLLDYEPEDAKVLLQTDLRYLEIDDSCSSYLCTDIRISNSAVLKKKYGMKRFQVVFANIVRELQQSMSFCRMCYCLARADRLTVFLGLHENNESLAHEQIIAAFSQLCSKFKNQSAILRVGVGNPVHSIWECSVSSQNARYALQFAFGADEQQVFDISILTSTPLLSMTLSDEAEERLISLISQKNTQLLKQYIDELRLRFVGGCYSESDIYIYIYSFILKLLKFLNNIGVSSGPVEQKIVGLLQNPEHFNSSDEVFEWMYQLCVLICSELESSLKGYHAQLCDKVFKYIGANYGDPELSLTGIAGYVNMSTTHLCAVFKRTTGKNISDSITAVRMERAKALLLTTNLPLKDISETVGFSNQYYFSACFKKNVGVTPSVFRASGQSEMLS